MKTKNFKFKSMALMLFALVLSSNVWGQSTTYTSNVTFNAGANGSTCSVVINSTSYDGMKLGTSSKTGTMTFTIPMGTTKIHIHAAKWNGESGNLNISASVGTLGSSSIALTADAGVSGNSPFTLSNPALASTTYYFEISISNVTAQSTITLTTSAKRAVVWGVNTEAAASKTLSSIAVTTQPTKKNYTTCETLDLSGCVVTATYSDESTENVTSSCTFNPADGAALTKSVTSVAVSYSGKNTTITEISVTDGAKDTFVDYVQGTADQYGECNGYTIPSCSDVTKGTGCEGEHYKFIGWSDKRIQTGVEIEPAGLLKAGETHDADDTTYYAVWAKEDE